MKFVYKSEFLDEDKFELVGNKDISDRLDSMYFRYLGYLSSFNKNYEPILYKITLYIKAYIFEYHKKGILEISQIYDLTTDFFIYIEQNRSEILNGKFQLNVDKTKAGLDFLEIISLIFEKKKNSIVSDLWVDKGDIYKGYNFNFHDLYVFLILTYMIEYSFSSAAELQDLLDSGGVCKYALLLEKDFFIINELFLMHIMHKSNYFIKSSDIENNYKEIGKRELTAKGGKAKGRNYIEKNMKAFRNIEELWDTGKWKNASKCAEEIFDLDEIKLPFNTVYNYLRKYKKKN